MVITFDELRKLKDNLPHGSMQKIADELKMDVDTVRNYFGGSKYSAKTVTGVHYEKGIGGGIVKMEDTRVYDCAVRMLRKAEVTGR